LGDEAKINSQEGAENLVSFMLQMANEFADTPSELKDLYRKNKATIDVIDRDYPDQYQSLKDGFSTLKNKLSTTED